MTAPLRLQIDGAVTYGARSIDVSLAPGESRTLRFDRFVVAPPQDREVRASIHAPFDMDPSNDELRVHDDPWAGSILDAP